MRRRAFLKILAGLALVPFLHAPVRESLADAQAGAFLKKLGREPYGTSRWLAYNTGPSEWIQAHGIVYNRKLHLIPITTGRFTA